MAVIRYVRLGSGHVAALENPVRDQGYSCEAAKVFRDGTILHCWADLGHSGYHWAYGKLDAFHPWEDE